MKTWATIDDYAAAYPGEQVTANELRTATLVVGGMLYGASFNPDIPAAVEALRDATVMQAHATHAQQEASGAAGGGITPDMLQSASINGVTYQLRDKTTRPATAETIDVNGRSVEAWQILRQAGLLTFAPVVVG